MHKLFILMPAFLLLVACDNQPAQTEASTSSEPVTETAAQVSAAPEVEIPTEADPLIASTKYGKVRGTVEDGITVFKGIRYGADTATTRFMAPQPPEPWADVKDALAYGNSTLQRPPGDVGLFKSWRPEPAPAMSEDCLFLNVWTPALRDDAKRPVMVWFHGGGFSTGSGSSNVYDGVRLAKRGDVVVVTINHRLNIFGHLSLSQYGEQFADAGNVGILDLIHSLEWVRDNIEEFGGDPNNVLIFGESGGGMKVSVLMAMDAAKGLFHRAVVQSGPSIQIQEAEQAAVGAAKVVEALGLDENSIAQILTIPAADIQKAAASVAMAGGPVTWAGPVVDNKNLKRHPFHPDAPPQSKDIPLLIGTTSTEMSLFLGMNNPDVFNMEWDAVPDAMMQARLGSLMPKLSSKEDAQKVIDTYRSLQPDYTPSQMLFTALTDASFLNGSLVEADRKAAQGGAPVYVYMMTWTSPVDGGKWLAPHAYDIGMVFDNVAKSESMTGIGEAQQHIADMMSEAWLAFAKSGNPNHAGLPEWSAYTAEVPATMIFDTEPKVVNDPHGSQRQVWLELAAASE